MSSKLIKWPQVILFGDSLCQRSFEPLNGRWGALLQDRLQRIADVIPRGFSGYNSKQCRTILPFIFNKENVSDIATFLILVGANDSSAEGSIQHVPLDQYGDNLVKMVEYLQSIGVSKEKILLITPPPYNEEAWSAFVLSNERDFGNIFAKATAEYVEAVHVAGKQCDVEVVDLYFEMMKDQNWKRFFIEGLHFSGAGADKVFSLIWPYIARRINTKTMILPYYRDFDATIETS